MANEKPEQPVQASASDPALIQRAATVAKLVELRNLYLASHVALLKEPLQDVTAGFAAAGARLAINRQINYTVDEAKKILGVVVQYFASAFGGGEKERELVQVNAAYVVEYELSALPPEADRAKDFEAFASTNAVFNSWPYWRELVQSSFSRMTLPPIIIPVFRAAAPQNVSQSARANWNNAPVDAGPGKK